ncbi:MAG TPA: sugar phosphate isomerase/epimerase family protein [Methanoregulaceae archaeon]|nr:sugar phosphate isomerase/epimerase family protein [Methanoregulaceae archaeon]HOV68484.1 sugar phosphate isomerase/epimerase family protein [Methanoregulaceae archaeon]
MRGPVFFSSSAKVTAPPDWVYDLQAAGFDGWEIVAEGDYRLDHPPGLARIRELIETTGLRVTVHAPYGDLNCASLNYPILRESVRQVTACIRAASEWTDRVVLHPGYLSPLAKLDPERAWTTQKEALREIGRFAADHGVLACLENMISVREFLCRDPGELLGMIEGIEGIGACFDLGHAHTVGVVQEFVDRIGRADHLHLHDNHGVSDEHLAVGDGTIGYDLVGPGIAAGFRGIAVVEGRSVEEGRRSLGVIRRWG